MQCAGCSGEGHSPPTLPVLADPHQLVQACPFSPARNWDRSSSDWRTAPGGGGGADGPPPGGGCGSSCMARAAVSHDQVVRGDDFGNGVGASPLRMLGAVWLLGPSLRLADRLSPSRLNSWFEMAIVQPSLPRPRSVRTPRRWRRGSSLCQPASLLPHPPSIASIDLSVPAPASPHPCVCPPPTTQHELPSARVATCPERKTHTGRAPQQHLAHEGCRQRARRPPSGTLHPMAARAAAWHWLAERGLAQASTSAGVHACTSTTLAATA